MPNSNPDSLDSSIFDNTVFARVVDGLIVEYPVLYKHIVNRDGPKNQFKQVVVAAKPAFDDRIQKLTENVTMEKGLPTVGYKVADLTVDEILAKLWRDKANITMADVAPEVFQKVSFLSDAYATHQLDAFAQSRRYANMASLATYTNDPVEQNSLDAVRGVNLRSQIYGALKQFEHDVFTGVRPVPKSFADILALFPELTW